MMLYIRAKLLVESEEFSMEENYTKSKAEGLAEGKVEIARNLLAEGTDIKMISKATEISEEELNKL